MKSDRKILICLGTRPEWLKIKPLLQKMGSDSYSILFTGQHEDLLKEISTDYRIKIEESSNRLDSIVSSCLTQFPNEQFSAVLVQGDTASAFACALAAFHRGIFIYYLEAGLRTRDLNNPYPEEGYRQMISRISNVNFAPTNMSLKNLIEEGVFGTNYVVGNTVLDNLVKYSTGEYGNVILVTMHRRENHSIMKEWFFEINELASKYPQYEFVLPIHPNPSVRQHKDILTSVKVIEPISHEETMGILKDCRLVITDSGGLQEESAFFNKKVIVCRKNTERPEGLHTGHLHICESPSKLQDIFQRLEKDYVIDEECPYGNGHSSDLILKIISNERLS